MHGTLYFLLAFVGLPYIPHFLLAALITSSTVVLTRALHLDGLADLADGVGGGYTPERRLEIMKDSRIGAFGALALMIALILKTAAIHAILTDARLLFLLVIPSLGRYAMVVTAFRSPYARAAGGLGKPFLELMSSKHLIAATGLCFAIAFLLAPGFACFAFPILFVTVALLRVLTLRWLGGVTGDVLGAVNEIAEVILLALAASLPLNLIDGFPLSWMQH
jgi:adenosylcobinamide-GDP ribazoletransferase